MERTIETKDFPSNLSEISQNFVCTKCALILADCWRKKFRMLSMFRFCREASFAVNDAIGQSIMMKGVIFLAKMQSPSEISG
ncbi:hypothetical protein [Burkholderia vietnamiensis]|uniref:hypothetical protein n=1 Tax=Burkholderia vietnamiensis TaxID=60552 RepID=UPI001041459B|nr:hypothetical protein [Burkholderia vietnamiensis]